jgi:outer membrane PBP1 activator LpoA protein
MFRRALHLSLLLLSITSLLYETAPGRASEGAPSPPPTSIDASVSPHVALLLPTGSEAFAKPAEAVRAGFTEAAGKQSGTRMPVRLYGVSDDSQAVLAGYRQALSAGAQMIVGPLTRNGVTALTAQAGLISVPTLALNVPEALSVYPSNLYTLSLQVEAEARQIAQVALRDGRRKALTVSDETPLGKRMRDAFAEEFQAGGGTQLEDVAYETGSAALERIRRAASEADMVFLALDVQRARVIKPQIAGLAGYGTSQLNPGLKPSAALIDLDDVRFVDMPWMVQPDHPAVMTYLRDAPRGADDLERLYALGIDSFRVAQEILGGKREFDVDGVTGRLTLTADGQIKRTLLVVVISAGKLSVVPEAPR